MPAKRLRDRRKGTPIPVGWFKKKQMFERQAEPTPQFTSNMRTGDAECRKNLVGPRSGTVRRLNHVGVLVHHSFYGKPGQFVRFTPAQFRNLSFEKRAVGSTKVMLFWRGKRSIQEESFFTKAQFNKIKQLVKKDPAILFIEMEERRKYAESEDDQEAYEARESSTGNSFKLYPSERRVSFPERRKSDGRRSTDK
ncbi:MAG: hypothetical protein PHD95_04030 [Candidatus ainarchaeum sp.]|nr:hypothetical protein [Candidatus ainarchaeum sp.]